MSEQNKKTIIENGTEFEGSIRSDCDIALSGSVKGKLNAPALTVSGSGTVEGQVNVSRLKSEGEISGEIVAETVELSGRVNDQTIIRAKSLQVKLTQSKGGVEVCFGDCELEIGDKPADPMEEDEVSDRQAEPVKQTEETVDEVVDEEVNVVDQVSKLLK